MCLSMSPSSCHSQWRSNLHAEWLCSPRVVSWDNLWCPLAQLARTPWASVGTASAPWITTLSLGVTTETEFHSQKFSIICVTLWKGSSGDISNWKLCNTTNAFDLHKISAYYSLHICRVQSLPGTDCHVVLCLAATAYLGSLLSLYGLPNDPRSWNEEYLSVACYV